MKYNVYVALILVTNLNTHFNRVKIYSSLWDTKVAKEIVTMNNREMTKKVKDLPKKEKKKYKCEE